MDCVSQWQKCKNRIMKRGFFTPEEDQIIRTRVKEWNQVKKGLWKQLESELSRPGKSISQRWRKQLNCS